MNDWESLHPITVTNEFALNRILGLRYEELELAELRLVSLGKELDESVE
jgi:hypothetical protein